MSGLSPVEPTAPPSADRLARLAWEAVCQGVPLLLVLVFFRFEKALVLRVSPGAAGWPAFLLPELAFVLAFEGGWIALAPLARRRGAWLWRLPFYAALLAVYLLALGDHVFFLRSGTRLRLDLLSYAVGNFRMLTGLLATGVDRVLLWRLVLIVCCLVLGGSLGRKPSPLPRRRLPAAALVAVAAGCALLLVQPAPPGRQAAALAASAVPEFFRGAWGGAWSEADVAADLVSPEDLYRRPEVDPPDPAAGRPPNLVLAILESTGAGVVPPYAPPEAWAASPNLAALAARAVVFDRVYTSVPHTSKALVGILCGMFPHLEMANVEAFEGAVPLACLPRLLAPLGYRNAFLQTALGAFENRPGLIRNLGFELAAFQETLGRSGEFGREGYLGMDDFAMLGPAVEWAAEGGPEPYFLTVLTVTTHHPYEVAGEPWAGETREQYERALAHQDRFVGALHRGLAAAGALDDTVVIVVGDHGEAFGEHGGLQHDAVPYEEVVRVPLLVLGPAARIGPPRRVGGLRHHFDLVPTVLGLAGARWRGVLPGRDLFAPEGHERVLSFCWYTNFCAALREGDRKVVFHFGRLPTEVFDLAADPAEERDLASTLPPEAIDAAERRIVATQLSVDAFYAQFPKHEGPALWWNDQVGREGP